MAVVTPVRVAETERAEGVREAAAFAAVGALAEALAESVAASAAAESVAESLAEGEEAAGRLVCGCHRG